MSRVLVAYGTKHGATAEIAEAIADEIRKAGHEADCIDAEEQPDVGAYDAVVLGSAVYMKRWQRSARRLLSREAKLLEERPFWVFSSGPCGKDADPTWAEPPRTIEHAVKLGAREHVVFGGRVPLEPSNFMERAMVEATPEDLCDLRNWDTIRGWAARIAADLA